MCKIHLFNFKEAELGRETRLHFRISDLRVASHEGCVRNHRRRGGENNGRRRIFLRPTLAHSSPPKKAALFFPTLFFPI